jgi:Rrf2 family protein
MLITRATEYAIRAVIYLAKQPHGEVVLKKDICKTQAITPAFLTKIFQPLIKRGIVGSQRGVGGGFFLATTPDKISLFDIVQAEEGDILFNHCQEKPGACDRDDTCPVHDTWKKIRTVVTSTLQEVTFAELILHEEKKLRSFGLSLKSDCNCSLQQ